MKQRLGNGLGDSNGVSLDFNTISGYLNIPFEISKKEKEILRKLAYRIKELSKRPVEDEKRELWYRHNALEETRPIVFCDPENGWYEILADKIESVNPIARLWEFRMKKEIFWGEEMLDDKVIEDKFFVHYLFTYGDFGMAQTMHSTDDANGSVSWDPAISDIADVSKLHVRDINIEYEKTRQLYNLALETFGDILHVEYRSAFWWSFGLTWDLIYLRGLDTMMLDMYDHPEEFHQIMGVLRDDALNRIDFLEKNNLLTLNSGSAYVGSGGYGWSRELPAEGFNGNVRAMDMWGFSESQETVGISPQMFAEFILPYQIEILERFGLNCYGCCEPLNLRWEYVKTIPRLRRVSVSSWADVHAMSEMLGKDYIFSWKPRPADLATATIDKDSIEKYIAETVQAAKANNCRLEIIMKDNHTIAGNPQHVIDWVKIARIASET
jgi:hypothetical protein